MKNETISVIIPIYKVERFLRKCLDSVLGQTYRDLEIVLVDDGSPDGCGAICDEYAAKDERIRVIHKENGGVSAARNTGLEAATGAYIGFVDSDDYIAPDMYEKLHAALTKTGVNVSLCDTVRLNEAGQKVREIPPLPGGTFTRRQVYEQTELTLEGWRHAVLWNHLYRRSLFDTVRFPEGKLFEDAYVFIPLMEQCQTITVVPEVLYYYVWRDESIMRWTSFAVQKLDDVDQQMQRYAFYRQRGWKDIARATLHKSYQIMWEALRGVDPAEGPALIHSQVRKVAKAQLCSGDLHGLWLEVGYLRWRLSGLRRK